MPPGFVPLAATRSTGGRRGRGSRTRSRLRRGATRARRDAGQGPQRHQRRRPAGQRLRQTVSNVLNNRTSYSRTPATASCAPSRSSTTSPTGRPRGLRSQRTMQLGYHMPVEQLAAENAFVLGFIQALVRAAADRGHHVLVPSATTSWRCSASWWPSAGWTASSSPAPGSTTPGPLPPPGRRPLRHVRPHRPGLPQTWVDTDGVAATAAVVDYLTERGHEAFAYVGYEAKNYWDVERLEGFRRPWPTTASGSPKRHHPGPPWRRSTPRCCACWPASADHGHRHRQRRAGRGGCERGQVLPGCASARTWP